MAAIVRQVAHCARSEAHRNSQIASSIVWGRASNSSWVAVHHPSSLRPVTPYALGSLVLRAFLCVFEAFEPPNIRVRTLALEVRTVANRTLLLIKNGRSCSRFPFGHTGHRFYWCSSHKLFIKFVRRPRSSADPLMNFKVRPFQSKLVSTLRSQLFQTKSLPPKRNNLHP